MDSFSKTTKHPPQKRSKTFLILGIITVILSCLLVTISTVITRTAYFQSSRAVTISNPVEPGKFVYALSSEQREKVRLFGYPDAFTIYFYQLSPDVAYDQGSRFESWSYYKLGLMFNFLDGEFLGSDYVPVLDDELLPLPYQPEQFSTFMTLEDLKKSTGIREYVIQPVEPEVVQGAEVMYADQLAFGMKNNHLIYVEALALTEEK